MTVQRFGHPLAAILIGFAFAAPLSAEPPAAPVAARAAVVEEAEEPVEQIRPDADRLFAEFSAAAFGWLRVELPAAAEVHPPTLKLTSLTITRADEPCPPVLLRRDRERCVVEAGEGVTDFRVAR